jgi:hypothetical protein
MNRPTPKTLRRRFFVALGHAIHVTWPVLSARRASRSTAASSKRSIIEIETCAIKEQCTTGKERRITRWEHEHVLETVQRRLDQDPQAMRRRRETVEHPSARSRCGWARRTS